MPRGYRCIIIAALGWLVLAAGQPKGGNGQGEEKQDQRYVAEALNRIEATLKEASKPDITSQPCEDSTENRKSDLCAQWKAADAAQSSANATWLFGTLGTLIGGATLVAAYMAAKYAKQAADSSIKAYKAFIAVEGATLLLEVNEGIFVESDESHWSFRPRIYNLGRAPAILHFVTIGDETEMFECVIAEGADPQLPRWRIPYRESPRHFSFEIVYASGAHDMVKRTGSLIITDTEGNRHKPIFRAIHGDTDYRERRGKQKRRWYQRLADRVAKHRSPPAA